MDGDGHLRQRARVRCSALSWLVIILGNLIVSGVAQGQWTYDSANYSTKAEAIAAMRCARPQNSVLKKELPPTSMNAYSSVYTYTAPPVPISFGAPSYETWCAGA